MANLCATQFIFFVFLYLFFKLLFIKAFLGLAFLVQSKFAQNYRKNY